jgi:subtilisin family serine protease
MAALILAASAVTVVSATPVGGAQSTNRIVDGGWMVGRAPASLRPTATTSEGLDLLGVPAWHAGGYTGKGVTVAVLDVGFDGLEDIPADDFPADLVAIAFDSDGILDRLTDHGAQMVEIVHDVAPDADLVTMTFADHRFAEAVAWLEITGVDVVSFSMEWTDGPLDGTHWTAPIIQASIDAGVVWVVAAGNSADTHHNGTTMDVDGDGWIEVTTGGIEQNGFTVKAGDTAEVSLSWNDPTTDLDLCLFDMEVSTHGSPPPTLITCTENPQGGTQPATEVLSHPNVTGTTHRYGYGLVQRSGPQTTYEVRTWGTGPLQFANPAASIGVPGNMADVITVGAVAWDTARLQTYSAWGPNHMGDRKPEVVGPDETATSAWIGAANQGTSYATPHVAGLVALMLEAAPTMTPAAVKQRIIERASRADDPDYKHGWGVAGLGQLPSTIVEIRGHWAEEAIDWAFADTITAGCPLVAQLTCPELAVTRDEMSRFLWRFRGLPLASVPAPFIDIPGDATYRPAVDWLAEAEITLGCTPTTYCPEGTVTRAEMAAFLWRLEGSPVGSATAGFSDVPVGFFAEPAIDWLLASGTTVGCTSTTYCPEELVTRAEMFTFLQRLGTATT